MYDVENYVVDYVKTQLNDSSVYLTSIYEPIPSHFPCVSVEMTENYVTRNRRTCRIDNADTVTFEINVYTIGANKKRDCKAIFGRIDAIMARRGFTREIGRPVPNADISVYRFFGRYTAIVDCEETTREVQGETITDYLYTFYQN